MSDALNLEIARRFEELGRLLEEQGANPFRVRAYQRAVDTLRSLDRPVAEILEKEGLDGLIRLPTIGEQLARAIRQVVRSGRLPMLERLRGEADPEALLASVPGIGPVLAERLHHELDIDTLEGLEIAAHSGRLREVPGFGTKRIAGVVDTLASRLGRVRRRPSEPAARRAEPPVGEILDVDREYREKAASGDLRKIAPRRFNPGGEAWLPILHTARGERHYTALFSNTARAHRLGRQRDWVVIYFTGGPTGESSESWSGEGQNTVVTAREPGPLERRRVVRGREAECLEHYRRKAGQSFCSESVRPGGAGTDRG